MLWTLKLKCPIFKGTIVGDKESKGKRCLYSYKKKFSNPIHSYESVLSPSTHICALTNTKYFHDVREKMPNRE